MCVTYFEQSTPVGELEHAKIGSRPARRNESPKLSDLRAIPVGLRLDAVAAAGAGVVWRGIRDRGVHCRSRGALELLADDGAGVSAVHRPAAQRGDGAGQGGPGDGAAVFDAGDRCEAARADLRHVRGASSIARCARCWQLRGRRNCWKPTRCWRTPSSCAIPMSIRCI